MLKPSQPNHQSQPEATATTSGGGQHAQNSTNNTHQTNNNNSGNHHPHGSNGLMANGIPNGRVSNVSFASYDKVGSIDKVVDENPQLLADNATPLKTTSVANANCQPTKVDQTKQARLEQTLTLLKSPEDENEIATEEINVSLLNNMFSSMGNQRRPNHTKSESVRSGQLPVVEGRTIGVVSNLSGSERINDIYVNRNVAALYSSAVREPVGTKPVPKTIHVYEDPFSGAGYKGFYLHGDNRVTSDLSDTKVYNAFSRKLRPDASAILKQTPIRNWDSIGQQEQIAFEDDELTNILG